MARLEETSWTFLLRLTSLILVTLIARVTPTTPSRPASLTGCVFLPRGSATCHWEAAEPPPKSYTLVVKRVTTLEYWNSLGKNTSQIPGRSFSCTTSDSNCTVVTDSSFSFLFCVSVTAHLDSGDVTSQRECQSGILETIFPPVILENVTPRPGDAACLTVAWRPQNSDFPLTSGEIKVENGKLKSQIEVIAEGQSDVEVQDVTVRDYSFQFCRLKPDTSYTVRLRHRYDSPQSPWGSWSLPRQGRTSESAPSAAPTFWSRVSPGDQDGRRRVTLLWKPLPHFLANGRVLYYNITCRGARQVKELDSCGDLHAGNTWCRLWLPLDRCSCNLTASNSAGTSPEAQVWLRSASEEVLLPPAEVTAVRLDDRRLDVRWIAPAGGSVSGFVAKWFIAGDNRSAVAPWWELLNASCTSLVITEGVQPMKRYVVSVSALDEGGRAGLSKTITNYTRQGAPSAGPNASVEWTSGSSVRLSWLPVPVEQRRGFIRNYTLFYWRDKREAQRESLPASYGHHTLRNLLPGTYFICMQANTDAGGGANGSTINVHITETDSHVPLYVLLAFLLTSLLLLSSASLMVKKKLSQRVPDPSNSSLAHWSSKVSLKGGKLPALAVNSVINISKLTLLGQRQPLTSASDEDLSSQSLDLTHSHSYHRYSQPPISEDWGPGRAGDLESTSVESSAPRTRATFNSQIVTCSVWPTELCSQTTTGSHPQSLLPFNQQTDMFPANGPMWPLGGVYTPTRPLQRLGAEAPSNSVHSSTDGELPANCWTSSSSDSSSTLARSSALTVPELLTLPQPSSLFVDFSYCHL